MTKGYERQKGAGFGPFSFFAHLTLERFRPVSRGGARIFIVEGYFIEGGVVPKVEKS